MINKIMKRLMKFLENKDEQNVLIDRTNEANPDKLKQRRHELVFLIC